VGDKTVDNIDLHRYFTGLTYTDVQYKPFHNQLSKPEFLTLIKRLVGMAMGNWQQQILGTDVPMSAFKRIVAQDGSSFAVHDDSKDTFKRQFTTISPTAVELHVSWDMLSSQPETISVSADSVAEYDFLPKPATLVDSLFLADRGYFKFSYLDSIHQAAGYYAVRAKKTCNPLVVAGYNGQGKVLKRFKQVKLKEVKKHIRKSGIVDMDVQGKTAYRMVASWPKDKEEPGYWVSNLSREQYTAATLIKLYSLCWQIELLFKE
jgi:IS4 transposase